MGKKGVNIVLIGMPGCGKTTIGKLVAKRLDMKFCDIDHYIEEKEGRSIPDIFKNYGEIYFRKLESKAVEKISKYADFVISTGGGVIKFHNNMEFLKKSGIIIFINRSVDDIISDIETDGRPLLKDGKERLYKLYKERIDLYKKYSDYEVVNDGSIEDIVNNIIQIAKSKSNPKE
ncbi:shikimate kinase [Paramaledivibacter caminithermalis]|jgi:shikimate kinase|uniref:Shikimate kinase n=1 Tax=Paramaledivibacter caminithermalis (strain DSM 15212 / CIP 107654 / DViRD3) TaxID=1121301 RepID=A0A1M6PLA9_PARC5|nr:shikimate kinase [Paramaledivibacter caminithermalis]SHK08683.1 shikimate kinase [Paramaledivibacter caminithermalis DSM 15212]